MSKKKKIVWTEQAHQDRENILQYWINHNKSDIYSIKLDSLFLSTLELIKTYPKIGKKTDISDNIRIKVVRDYEIFYQLTEHIVYILTIWDSRNDLNKLSL
jgi:plasmid stabilization system protein ParE